jgi:hypothetical protein
VDSEWKGWNWRLSNFLQKKPIVYESIESPILRMQHLNTQVALKRPKRNRNTARIAQMAEKLPQKLGEISYVHGTECPHVNGFRFWAAKAILKGLLKYPPGPLREQLMSVVTRRIANFVPASGQRLLWVDLRTVNVTKLANTERGLVTTAY